MLTTSVSNVRRKSTNLGVRVGIRCRLGRRYLPFRRRHIAAVRQGVGRDLLQGDCTKNSARISNARLGQVARAAGRCSLDLQTEVLIPIKFSEISFRLWRKGNRLTVGCDAIQEWWHCGGMLNSQLPRVGRGPNVSHMNRRANESKC